MGEIIKVEFDSVVVGLDDGSVIRVNISNINFIPEIGNKVRVFKDENGYLISKINEQKPKNENMVYRQPVSNNTYTSNKENITNNYYIGHQGKAVNKIAYALLAFFLGGIGAHKFYAGKIGTGILYLIFAWTFIPSIIAFIEFIIALTKPSNENGEIYV